MSVYRSITIFKAPAISLLPAGHLSSKSAKPQACTHKLLEQSTHLNVLVFSDTYTHTLTHSLPGFSASYRPAADLCVSCNLSISVCLSNKHRNSTSSVWPTAAWANLPMLTGLPNPSWMLQLSSGTEWLFAVWTQLADAGNLIKQPGLAEKRYFQEPVPLPTAIAATSRHLLMHTNSCRVQTSIPEPKTNAIFGK